MNDLPGLSRWAIPSFSFSVDRSSWAKVKGFAENIEAGSCRHLSSANKANTFDGAIIDGRGLTVNIHYSISKLPESGYKPRAADERVGYFTTAIKNLNKNPDDGNFIRYINRWNLQKLEPGAKVSLPKKPILFWLDKNMPYAYRKPIRDGILEWNKAFEKAGFTMPSKFDSKKTTTPGIRKISVTTRSVGVLPIRICIGEPGQSDDRRDS